MFRVPEWRGCSRAVGRGGIFRLPSRRRLLRLAVTVRLGRSGGLTDEDIRHEIIRQGGRKPPPAEPSALRKHLNRWEDRLEDDGLVIGEPRGSGRERAAKAVRAVRGRWLGLDALERGLADPNTSRSVAQCDEIARRLGRQVDALTAAACVPGMFGVPDVGDLGAYLARAKLAQAALIDRAWAAREATNDHELPAERGSYLRGGIAYRAVPVDVARITSPECGCSPEWNGSRAYTCACAECLTYRTRAMLLGAAARNRPQPWHVRRRGGGPLLVLDDRVINGWLARRHGLSLSAVRDATADPLLRERERLRAGHVEFEPPALQREGRLPAETYQGFRGAP